MGLTMHHHMSVTYAQFKDGDTIVIEPWRASAFPVIRDCAVDRSAFDRIIKLVVL